VVPGVWSWSGAGGTGQCRRLPPSLHRIRLCLVAKYFEVFGKYCSFLNDCSLEYFDVFGSYEKLWY
jgi:hypothetical protein